MFNKILNTGRKACKVNKAVFYCNPFTVNKFFGYNNVTVAF